MPRCLQTCTYLYVSYCCQLLSMKWRSIMQYLSVVLRIKLVCVHAISLSPTADQLHVIVHSLTVGEWRECDTHNPLNRFYSAPKYHIRWRLMCCTPKSPRMFDLQSQCQCVVLTVLDAWTKRFRWNSGSIPSVSLGFICFMAFNEFWNSCAYLQTIDVIKRMHNFFLQRKMIRQILLTINYNF